MLKKHVVFNLRRGIPKRKIRNKINLDLKTLLFFVFMLCGIIIGTYIFKRANSGTLFYIEKLFGSFLLPLSSDSHIFAYLKLFLPFAFLVFICFLIGLSGTGTPFLSSVPFLCGVLSGIYVSFCYNSFGGKEIVCRVLIFLPIYATATASLIKCCCRSSVISGEIFSYLLTGKGEGKGVLKDYCLEYLVLLLPVALSCLVSLVIFNLLNGSFNVFS